MSYIHIIQKLFFSSARNMMGEERGAGGGGENLGPCN